ncbi:tail fiber domain-containing protein [Streptomyces aureoverticillatus]|uniref:tail fiber domain-containing protein n=1 Tax=Streptomyces aureoverticillatus TaxID=66871 RepID=UPI0013DAE92B|nr:tail fiber domain-containing protein [Streptomyces aureoverticillatus]QIB42816.1 tail fiber domain-containing protein [Streptomyces aureoverticillatus]
MEKWQDFRGALAQLMKEGGVSVRQLVQVSDPKHPPVDRPDLQQIAQSTAYSYIKAVDARVGSGDWDIIRNLLQAISYAAAKNDHPVRIDFRRWNKSWQRLEDRHVSRRPGARTDEEFLPSAHDSWIGGWDGAADAVLAHSSAEEFTEWPHGSARLDVLSQAVAQLSAAYEPELAKNAAQRLVDGALAEFGEGSAKTLAARHALAFWTGHTGDVNKALELTSQLNVDCTERLGPDHILVRLARLRGALWLSHTGRWREANRVYTEAVEAEGVRPDRDHRLWLLARWGMARTGGRSGNWGHAATELGTLLDQVESVFGADHPTTLDARSSRAGAVGRAGDAARARELLEPLAEQADRVLLPSHPTAIRIRIALSFWTHRAISAAESLPLAQAIRKQCTSHLGPDHPLTIMAIENEAISQLDLDQGTALNMFQRVMELRERRFGKEHPLRLQTELNYAAARATVEGPGPVVEVFRDLARELGEVLGEEHPETLRAGVNWAISILGIKGAREALPQAIKTERKLTKVLGKDHPETVAAAKLLESITLRIQDQRPNASNAPPSSPAGHSYLTFHGDEASSDRGLKHQVVSISWRRPADATAGGPGVTNGVFEEARPEALDGYDVLRAVASLPVSTWSYRGDDDVRHLGPMAQDWHAALGLGSSDRTIHMVDVNGVSVVAIQALYRIVQRLQAEVNDLRHGPATQARIQMAGSLAPLSTPRTGPRARSTG